MHGIVTTLFTPAGLRACGLAVLVSIAAVFAPQPASALVEIDITQGNIEPLPIALAGLFRGRRRRQTCCRHDWRDCGRSQTIRPVQSARPGELHPEEHEREFDPALRRLAPDQRPGAGDRNRDQAAGRASSSRIPSVGRFRTGADARSAILHDAGKLAQACAYHCGRHLRAPDRRKGVFRHAHRLCRRDRHRRTSGSRNLRSWTRTVPMSAISHAATILF